MRPRSEYTLPIAASWTANDRSWPIAAGALGDAPSTRNSPTHSDGAPLTVTRTNREMLCSLWLFIHVGAVVETATDGARVRNARGVGAIAISTLPVATAPASVTPKPEISVNRPR